MGQKKLWLVNYVIASREPNFHLLSRYRPL